MIDVLALNDIDFLHRLDGNLLLLVLLQPGQFHVSESTYYSQTRVRNYSNIQIQREVP